MYFSAHNHTDYSNLRLADSTNKVKDLIDRAIELGLSGLAITDHEVLASHVKVDKYRSQLIEEGVIDDDFIVAFGDEIYLVDKLEKNQQYYHYILIAKDQKGYEQLKRISSQAWSNSYYDRGMERVPITYEQMEEIIGDEKGHLISSTACLGGFLPNTLMKMSQGEVEERVATESVKQFIDWNISMFGKDSFFFELQAGDSQEQAVVNQMVKAIGDSRDIKTIITTDSHYLSKEDRDIHRAFLHSQEGEREVDKFYEFTYMMSEEEITEILKGHLTIEQIEESLENTNLIKDMCSNISLKQSVDITKVPVKDVEFDLVTKEKFKEYKYISMYLNSQNRYDKALIHYVLEGIKAKKDVEENEELFERINVELEHVVETSERIEKNLSNYLLTARYLVDLMWTKGDSLVGPSRGSVTGFMIAYLIDIIQINPMKWNLPWWRFLHKDRPDLMDIDLDSQKTQRGQILEALNEEFGENRVLNISTFGTIGSKSSIISACRGLDIDDSVAHYLSGLVPEERGMNWSLSDVIYGNEKKGRKPQNEFNAKLKEYDDKKLRKTILAFEGIIDKRSIHASGIYIYNEDYYKRNAMMMSPSGVPTTQFDMADSDYMGGVKFDFLTVMILDKIRVAMEHLIDNGQMERQATLRETYDKYLLPNELEHNDEEMWKLAEEGKVVSLFQFDTVVGGKAIREVGPRNLVELATANSLMRLASGDADIQPLEKFIKYRNNIELWYEEMYINGVTEEEAKILKGYLDFSYGIAATQEDIMEILMDKNIADFTVVEAHAARKAIAKKKPKLIKQFKKDYYKRAKQRAGTRDELIEYVWNFLIVPQLGYSFSRNHTLPYSMIALQILNIVYKYSPLAWNAACLTVESGALDQESDDNESTNYGKVAVAISNMEQAGVKISPPDINKSGYVFTPDFEEDTILFGLKGLAYIGDDVVTEIVDNRPYTSYDDFYTRLKPSKRKIISLIKSNAFRNIEQTDRVTLLESYIQQKVSTKTSLSLRNMNALFSNKFFSDTEVRISSIAWYLRKILRSNNKKTINKQKYYKLEEGMIDFINSEMSGLNIETIDNEYYVLQKDFEDEYTPHADKLRNYISDNEEELLKKYNKVLIKEEAGDYLDGGIGKWEMDSISYYATENELDYINYEQYPFVEKFSDIPVKPVKMLWKNKYPIYHLSTIIGTCLSRSKNKHMVHLLTRSGVVTVKFRGAEFAYYDKQVKKDGSIIDSSFFSRGNKVMITGYRSGDNNFRVKTYAKTAYKAVYLIESLNEDGTLNMRSEKNS